uniref:Uncharacterized protein n=1 Tax=Anopheles maculatus TaxID=74869 RepID=A0A182T3K6_9DIPT
MYLFKQHYRRCHSDLGELIDLPPLPFLEEMVKYNHLEDELWFAILHTSPIKPILMRIFEAESHATMRIANRNDILEQSRRVSTKKSEDTIPTLAVLYDIYTEVSVEGTQTFFAVPKLKAQADSRRDKRPKACCDLTETWNTELSTTYNYLLDEIVLFNQ